MTKKIHLLSIVAIAAVLIAGSLAVSPMAIADDDDDDDDDATTCVGFLGPGTFDDIVVPSAATCLLRPGTFVDGDVDVEPTGFLSTFLGGVTIDGDVHAEGAFIVSITCSTVNGNVDIDGTTSFSRVTGSTVGGDVKIENSGTSIIVGPSPGFALCPGGNIIGGNVELEDNTTTFSANVAANTIGGDLECENNSPPPVLGPSATLNTVFGDKEGQCVGL